LYSAQPKVSTFISFLSVEILGYTLFDSGNLAALIARNSAKPKVSIFTLRVVSKYVSPDFNCRSSPAAVDSLAVVAELLLHPAINAENIMMYKNRCILSNLKEELNSPYIAGLKMVPKPREKPARQSPPLQYGIAGLGSNPLT
jgi:hypothetical protein